MDKAVESAESTSASPEVWQPETDFAEFYYGIISKLFDLKCRQISIDVRKALSDMRRLKHQTDNVKERIFFSYKIPPVRGAYMYAYSVLHTVIVYSEFSAALEENKRFLSPIFNRDLLRICCLGGGPGTEAVAICKSINDCIFESSTESEESLLEVSVTMVDKLPHWKREESAVINAVNDSSNVLHSKRIVLQTDFMKADLLKPFEKNLQEKIKEADIVTIVKCGNSIQEKNPDDCILELQNMVRNVIDSMDEGSLLFMLDDAGGNVFYNMMKVLFEEKDYSFLLKRSAHKEYSLDLKTMKKLEDLMKPKKDAPYRPMLPTGRGKVSSCLWIKNVIPVGEENNTSSKERKLKSASNGNTCCSMSKCEKTDENPDHNSRKGVLKADVNRKKDEAHHPSISKTEQHHEKGKCAKRGKGKNVKR